MPTWFLPPDFTYTSSGPLKLGTILVHPTRPTNILGSLTSIPGITPPAQSSITEPNHYHSKSTSHSASISIWAKFLEVASASTKAEASRSIVESYSAVDHEIISYSDPLTPTTISAITTLPEIQKFIGSGIFGKKPIYIVTGLRIAKSSFTVTKEVVNTRSGEVSASGPATCGIVPVEVGGSVGGSNERKTVDSYDTAPGIVFAYRVFVIRTKRRGLETELFEDKSAFLTGDAREDTEEVVVVEANEEELTEDIEEQVDFKTARVGEDNVCISF